jgi:hypothetical protein
MRLRIVPDPQLSRPAFTIDRERLVEDLAIEDRAPVQKMRVGDSIMLIDAQGHEYCVMAIGL